MLRGFRNKTRIHGLTTQTKALEGAGVKVIYDAEDRDKLIRSLRAGDFIVVAALSVLASNKADLRWVLIGEDKKIGYRGAFLRGAGVYDLEIDAKIVDMKHVETVLSATEDWARERRKRPMADDVKFGRRGGRLRKKRTDKHTAMIAWADRVKYPTHADALASDHMHGWSPSSAARPIEDGGLGPRGSLKGRLSKAA